jgi:hypothetical protein
LRGKAYLEALLLKKRRRFKNVSELQFDEQSKLIFNSKDIFATPKGKTFTHISLKKITKSNRKGEKDKFPIEIEYKSWFNCLLQ